VQVSLSDDDALWSFGTLNLIQDGGVRWHSVYLMLLRCLELKDPINRFIRAWRNQDANDDTQVPGNAAHADSSTPQRMPVRRTSSVARPSHGRTDSGCLDRRRR
jgi:hypothetical protein